MKAALLLLALSVLSPIVSGAPAQEPDGASKETARMTIAAADANRDQKVTEKEWSKFLKALKPKEGTVETGRVLGLVLQRHLDRDTDKKLEREDLVRVFEMFDTDDDGVVRPGEIEGRGDRGGAGRGGRSNWMDPNARRIARSVFAAADRDGDGEVPFGDWSFLLDSVMPRAGAKKGQVDLDELAAVFLPKRADTAPAGEGPDEPAPGGEETRGAGDAVKSIVQALDPDEGLRTKVEVLEEMFAGLDENEDEMLEREELTGFGDGDGRWGGGDDDDY